MVSSACILVVWCLIAAAPAPPADKPTCRKTACHRAGKRSGLLAQPG